MTETTMTAEPSAFRVGAVFSRAFDLLFRDFVKFYLLAALAWSPMLILGVFGALNANSIENGEHVAGVIAGGLGAVMLSVALFILSQAVVLYGAIEEMRGNTFAIGASLRIGLARFFPIFGMFILLGLGLMVGFVLLIVPGIMLAMAWYVALPACIVERKGPAGSLSRSAELTKGNRWRIFGIAAILYVVNMVVQSTIQFALLALAGQAVSSIGVFLWSVLVGAFGSIVIAVVYHDLRVAREGIDVDRIAAVFE